MTFPFPKNQAVGIEIGFRQLGQSIQVATIASSDHTEQPQAIIAPSKILRAIEHVYDLQSELDEAAALLGKRIKPILNTAPLSEAHPKYRLWKRAAKLPNNVTLSYETAYKLARWLKHEPEALPAEAAGAVSNCRFGFSRRYRELHNLRAKQLLNRKHFYKQVASELVARRELIVLEDIALSVFAEVRDRDNALS